MRVHHPARGLCAAMAALSACAVLAATPADASAATVVLGAGKVSTLFENQPDHSIGKGPAAFVGGDAVGSPRRGLIDFNLAANIPAGATITDVQLTLFLAGVAAGDTTPREIDLHRITADWAHGPTGLGVTQIDGTDQGFPAIAPSPTWYERRYQQNQPWATPGGDFAATVSATSLVGQALGSAYSWSSPQMVADAQTMLDAPSTNQGWELLNSDEWSAGSYRIFYTQAWDDTSLRPQLQVSYVLAAVPEPAGATLLVGGLLVLALRRRMNARKGSALLFMLLCANTHAAVITLTPSKDATIYGASMNQGLPNSSGQDLFDHSNGAGPGIFAGGNGQLAPHRALIEFDIASALPAGAVITSAQLTMYIGIVAGSGGAPGLGDQTPRTMDLFRLTRDWGEGTTGANATTVGGTGQGFPANAGDATWLQSAYQQVSWTTPGGDHVAEASSTRAVGSVFGSAQTWASTALMVSDVQGWLDDPASNDGWILINRDETLKQTHRAFYSSEWPDASLRPQLQISYELAPVPEPGQAALFVGGLALLSLRAMRRGRSRS